MLRSRINNLLWPHVGLPAASLLTRNKAWRYYKQFLASDHEPAEVRQRRQWQRVIAMVEHAYRNTRYYKALMDSVGLTPDRIRTPADLRRLPVTTKQDLRDHFPDELLARNTDLHKVRISNTSGTSGKPMVLVQDRDDINRKYASKLRTRALMDVPMGDRVLRLAPNECQPCFSDGSSPDVGFARLLKMWLTGHEDLAQARYIFIERELVNPLIHQRDFPEPLDPRHLDESVAGYIDLIERRRPQVLVGNPLYLYLVAREAERRGRSLRGIKAVDCTGELSTKPLRDYLARWFGAPVHQIYGGCEWGRLAGSCGHSEGLMHVLDDVAYLEFVDPDGEPVAEREPANIIVTGLSNRAMPLIRFEHGDVGWYTDEPCGCGRTSRRMDVEGRLQATVVRPGRQPVFTSALAEHLFPNPGVALFEVVQRDDDNFRLTYLPDRDHPLDAAEVVSRFREVLGRDCAIEVVSTDIVPTAPSGKYRLVRSASYQPFRCVEEGKRAVPLGEYW